ncbi:hypothetical protein NQ318_010232 [Aromia moschata]|uniref:Ig-like domain-containing protein n=1 Tax=Aromia moschata TaxID=1265417 RepID=A0AAV8YKP6_9CUCU|nr:hypothetical protein NQ318_010232 [Aromia moschata]
MEQRVNLKFLVKLGKTFTEAYAMLKEVYGNECLSCTYVFEWFKRLKEGPVTTKDDGPQRLLDTVTLKGTRFENVEAVKAKATEVLNQLTEADFQHCFQQWKSRMERCRDRQGEYIEGETVATPPSYLFWYHNNRMINYDGDRGINVTTDLSENTSTLTITSAATRHSGNYSCVPSNAQPASTYVHILNVPKKIFRFHHENLNTGKKPHFEGGILTKLLKNFVKGFKMAPVKSDTLAGTTN